MVVRIAYTTVRLGCFESVQLDGGNKTVDVVLR